MKRLTAWWFWLLVVVLLLAGIALGLRFNSLRQWERTKAEFHAQGLGTGLADLAAQAPMVDEKRQERLWAWLEHSQRMAWAARPRLPALTSTQEESNSDEEAERERNAKLFAAGRTNLADLEALLDEGPVVCSYLGWFRRDVPDPAHAVSVRVRSPGHRSCIEAAEWWAYAAITGNTRALDRLDAWETAHAHPGQLDDATKASLLNAIRDDVYWRLALANRLPADRLARWAGEPAEHATWGAAGCDGDRLARMTFLEEHGGGQRLGADVGRAICDWLSLHAAASATFRHEVSVARILRQGGAMAPDRLAGLHGFVAQGGTRWSPPDGDAAALILAMHQHRQRHQAALLLAAWRRDSALPSAWPMPVDLRLPPLVYERLSESRFRLGVDPAGPTPALVSASNLRFSQTGSPAGSEPLVDVTWSLELDCAAGWK